VGEPEQTELRYRIPWLVQGAYVAALVAIVYYLPTYLRDVGWVRVAKSAVTLGALSYLVGRWLLTTVLARVRVSGSGLHVRDWLGRQWEVRWQELQELRIRYGWAPFSLGPDWPRPEVRTVTGEVRGLGQGIRHPEALVEVVASRAGLTKQPEEDGDIVYRKSA
jgi:hypothetical protein